MNTSFEQTARILVDQHYAAGPDDLKQAVAAALAEAAGTRPKSGDPRQRLQREIAELEKTSERGSE